MNKGEDRMKFWASWWSGNFANEGCTEPPFHVWVSGERDRADGKDEWSICGHLAFPSEEALRESVAKHYPDCEWRFVKEVGDDFKPNNRFPPHKGAAREHDA